MKIDACKEFGMELNDEASTAIFASNFPDVPEGPLEIDLSACIIDYVATSALMDAALEKLQKARAPHILTVIFNIAFQERLFLKWLFLGSNQLGLKQGTATDEEIQDRIVSELKRLGLVLQIKIVDIETGEVTRTTPYGE